jgi:hypothetical protein
MRKFRHAACEIVRGIAQKIAQKRGVRKVKIERKFDMIG